MAVIEGEVWFHKKRMNIDDAERFYNETEITKQELEITHGMVSKFPVDEKDLKNINKVLNKLYYDFQEINFGKSECSYSKEITQSKWGIVTGRADSYSRFMTEPDIVIIGNDGYCAVKGKWLRFKVIDRRNCAEVENMKNKDAIMTYDPCDKSMHGSEIERAGELIDEIVDKGTTLKKVISNLIRVNCVVARPAEIDTIISQLKNLKERIFAEL